MSIGSWDPSAGADTSPAELTPDLLARLAGFSRSDGLADLSEALDDAEKQSLSALMSMDHDAWRSAGEPLDSDELVHLIRFFAVAENLPGWEAGDKSPVIPLAKILRQRGERLDRDMLLWLREVNENRFLPYGPL
ncbi:MAG: hypothetical protein ACPG1A_12405 [Halioglobus sp.]